jgi:hypothetical protein
MVYLVDHATRVRPIFCVGASQLHITLTALFPLSSGFTP